MSMTGVVHKIILVQGGLGNQMFCYAYYLALKQQYPQENIRMYVRRSCYSTHSGYLLNRLFGVREDITVSMEWIQNNRERLEVISANALRYFPEYHKTFTSETPPRTLVLDGYWQSEKYFTEIRAQVLAGFRFPVLSRLSEALVPAMQKKHSVSVHVRRGDYVRSLHDILSAGYYVKVMKRLHAQNNQRVFYVFSNDIAFCKNAFARLTALDIRYVDHCMEDWESMALMSQCPEHVISNSTFSWWAAWLCTHEDKHVWAPNKWFKPYTVSNSIDDILPADWERVHVRGWMICSFYVYWVLYKEKVRKFLRKLLGFHPPPPPPLPRFLRKILV